MITLKEKAPKWAGKLNIPLSFPFIEGMDGTPKTGYAYKVFRCVTAGEVQEVYDWGRMQEGFYPYLIPQSHGCMIVAAYADPEQKKRRQQPRIELGLTLLTEREAKKVITEVMTCKEGSDVYNWIDTFLTLLYEKGYDIGKRTPKEATA